MDGVITEKTECQVSDFVHLSEVSSLQSLYGACHPQIPEPNILKLLFSEILNPFYLFTLFSIIVWSLDGYEKFAACVFVCSLYGIYEALNETVSNRRSVS